MIKTTSFISLCPEESPSDAGHVEFQELSSRINDTAILVSILPVINIFANVLILLEN